MSRIILLDSGPLGLITNPSASEENRECNAWIQTRLREGDRVMVPAISDYEIRRELLRAEKTKGLARLDGLKSVVGYIPLTSEALLQAAEFWAEARRTGKPTAPDSALAGDVILCAQAAEITRLGHEAVIATTNVKHLELFADARLLREIS
jgi:predicted nucleic acid-binding protein